MIDYNTGEFPYFNQENYKRRRQEISPRFGLEINDEPSVTIPDDAMSIQEIFNRSVAGGIPPERRNIAYFDTEDVELINHFNAPGALDLTDLDELQRKVSSLQAAIETAQFRKNDDTHGPDPNPVPISDPTPDPVE